ncbi:MAG: hypothetical protein QOH76_2095 [Thermoleophilaceae bacterium]|jgi:hypothetical protein|nr:hypothetical protein [Thermoleophilaceae bacterium]
MYFGVIDIAGNVLSWHDDEASARAALDRMVESAPEAADEIVVFEFDDNGDPVGEPILPPRAQVFILGSKWLVKGHLAGELEKNAPSAARSGTLDPHNILIDA